MFVADILMPSCAMPLTDLSIIVIFAGSVQIDEDFQESFENKLSRIQREQPSLFEGFLVKDDVARDVTEGPFRDRKIGCGTEKLTTIKFRVPGLPDTSSVRVEFSKYVDLITHALG